jgi:hypothetical protein
VSKIAILSIHGIGEQKPGFADKFHSKLMHSLELDCEIKCFEFEWQHLIEPKENLLAKGLFKLGWKITRSFALNYLGDAVAYAKDSVFYKECHSELDKKLNEVSEWVGDGKIFIIAHSLGTIITYNYIYNLQNIGAFGNNIFRAASVNWLDKLDTVFFLGSPLYIYSLQIDSGGGPINVKNWVNIYSPFDVIGYPIKRINAAFSKSNVIDLYIICGKILNFWNPMSHLAYFDSRRVMKIFKNKIEGLRS